MACLSVCVVGVCVFCIKCVCVVMYDVILCGLCWCFCDCACDVLVV